MTIERQLKHYDWLVGTPSPHVYQGYMSPSYYQADELTSLVNEKFNIGHAAFQFGLSSAQFILQRHQNKGAVLSEIILIDQDSEWQTWDINQRIHHHHAVQYWRELMKNRSIKIIFILVRTSIDGGAHANMIIIDKVRKIVEMYDPHGFVQSHKNLLTRLIQDKLFCKRTNLDTCFIPQKYRLLSFYESCPMYGFQVYEGMAGPLNLPTDLEGYCFFWTLFMLDLRLGNLNFSTKEIQEYFISKYETIAGSKLNLANKFRHFIRRYAQYLAELHMEID